MVIFLRLGRKVDFYHLHIKWTRQETKAQAEQEAQVGDGDPLLVLVLASQALRTQPWPTLAMTWPPLPSPPRKPLQSPIVGLLGLQPSYSACIIHHFAFPWRKSVLFWFCKAHSFGFKIVIISPFFFPNPSC